MLVLVLEKIEFVELNAKQIEDEHEDEDDKSFIKSISVAPAGRIKPN